MQTSNQTKPNTDQGQERQGGSCLPESEMQPSADRVDLGSEVAYLTVVNGVAVPDTPEDAEICHRFNEKVAADPEKYAGYAWIPVE